MSSLLDSMLSAVKQFEGELENIKAEANAAARDLNTIAETRKQLVFLFSDIEQTHKKRTKAINGYNKEVERIAKYGRRAINLAKAPLPMEVKNMPAVTAAVKGKKEVYQMVNAVAMELPNIQGRARGIYFLLRGQDIVYIGQSVDCFSRVSTHATNDGKDFNRACYVPVVKEELNDMENTLIALFKPEYNTRGVTDHADESLAIFNTQEALES